MATTVGFVSEKGGVGKTTACYHIAVALRRFHQKRVLVVDGDYQRGGISGRFFPDVIETFGSGAVAGTTLFHKFQQLYSASPITPDIDIRTWIDEIDVIVADPRLATVSVDKLPSTNNIKENNRLLLRHLGIVSEVLAGLVDTYDYILIDSHPEVSDVLRSIIFASDYLVSPVKLDRQSSIGVATIIAEMNNVNADVEMMRRGLQEEINYRDTVFAGTIGMMTREWGGELKLSEAQEYNRLRRTGPIFDTYVTEGDGLRQAAAARVPVFDIGGANAQKQAQHFRELTREFLGRCPE
jgi:chromosome partitioning protein